MLVAWPSHKFRIMDAFSIRHCRQDPGMIVWQAAHPARRSRLPGSAPHCQHGYNSLL